MQSVIQLFKAGKFDDALPLAERVVVLREKALGPDHVEVAKSLSNLATILNQLSKFDRARDAYERALPILESKLGSDNALTNKTREDLAGVYYKRGDYKRAQALLEDTLSSREKTPGADHELVVHTLVELAYVYMALQRSEKRDETFNRLLDYAEKSPGQISDELSKLFDYYGCTGASHPDASESMLKVNQRIRLLYEDRIANDSGGKTISGGVLNGHAVARFQPDYPLPAREARIAGTVVVQVTVDEAGKVVDAKAVCGPSQLFMASVQAAKLWKFTPTLLDGVPVKVTGTITFSFSLH
jgi:TonB family protein